MKAPILARLTALCAGLVALCAPPVSSAAPGDLFVCSGTGGGIYRFTPDGTRTEFASGLYQPMAMAFDRKANLFVVDSGSGTTPMESFVYKFTPDGTRTTFVSLGFTRPLSMTFDAAGNLLVSDANTLRKYAPDGSLTTFATDVDAWPLAYDRTGILYAGINQFGPKSIWKFAPDGTHSLFVNFPPPSSLSSGFAFDPKGNLYVKRTTSIVKVTPDGTITTFLTGDFYYPLAFDSAGNLFACRNAYDKKTPCIVKFAPDGTETTFANPPPYFPTSIAIEPLTEKLRNLSARGLVGTGDDVLMIGGFVVGGNALATNPIVLRALGPSLSAAGVNNALADPVLELRDASGTLVIVNDNWRDTQEAQITATGLAPSDPNESAIYSTLPEGSYTAIVRGAHGSTGTALVEVYGVGIN